MVRGELVDAKGAWARTIGRAVVCLSSILLTVGRYHASVAKSLSPASSLEQVAVELHNNGSVKNSGRCIAFVNACKDYDIELTLSVYVAEEQKRFLARQLSFAKGALTRGKAKLHKRVFSIPRGQLISFNQKPLTTAKGKLTYFAAIEISARDSQTGAELSEATLSSDQLEKVNHFVSSALNDQAACSESGASQRLSAMVIVQTDAISDEIEAALSAADGNKDEQLARFTNGLSILVPFMEEKAVLDRLKLHMAQHPRSAKALGDTAKLALAIGRLSTGDVSAVKALGTSLKGLGEVALEGRQVPGWEKLKEGRIGQVAKKLKPERLLSLTEVLGDLSSAPVSIMGEAEGAFELSQTCSGLVHGVVEAISRRQERIAEIIGMIQSDSDLSNQLAVLEEMEQQSVAEQDAIRATLPAQEQEGQGEVFLNLLEVEVQVISRLKELVFSLSMQSI